MAISSNSLVFPFSVEADISDQMSMPGLAVVYGDGHKSRSVDGLKKPRIIWDIKCPLADKNREHQLEQFIRFVGNHTPFLWKSPRDSVPTFYYITGKIGGSYRAGGGTKPDFFVRSMQFEYTNITLTPDLIIEATIYLQPNNNKTLPIPTIYLQPKL